MGASSRNVLEMLLGLGKQEHEQLAGQLGVGLASILKVLVVHTPSEFFVFVLQNYSNPPACP